MTERKGRELASAPRNEQQTMEWVAEVVRPLQLPLDRLANLKTAVAGAVMNAMEHGNQYQPDKPVSLQILASQTTLVVHTTGILPSVRGTGFHNDPLSKTPAMLGGKSLPATRE